MKNCLGKRIIAGLLCLVVLAGSELTGLTNIVGDLFAAEEQEFEEPKTDVQTAEIEVELEEYQELESETLEELGTEVSEDPVSEALLEAETPEESEIPAPETPSEPEEPSKLEAPAPDVSSESEATTPDDIEGSEISEELKNLETPDDTTAVTTPDEMAAPEAPVDTQTPQIVDEASEDTNQAELSNPEDIDNVSVPTDTELPADTADTSDDTKTEQPVDSDTVSPEENPEVTDEEEEVWPEYDRDCTSDDGKVKVHVTAEEGVFPENTELIVKAIVPQDVEALEADEEVSEDEVQEAKAIQERFDAVQKELEESVAEDETKEIAGFFAYDISFWTEIKDEETEETRLVEVEPNGEVQVSMESEDGLLPEEVIDQEEISNIDLVHMKETEEGLELEILEDASIETTEEVVAEVKTIEFYSEEFSVYAVVWTKKEGLQELEYTDDDMKIIVKEKTKGSIPKGAILDVVSLAEEKEETKEQYQEIEKKLQESAQKEEYEVAGFLAYRFSLADQNNVPMPLQGEVEVTMEYKEAVVPAGVTDQSTDVSMAMINPEVTEGGTEDVLVKEGDLDTLNVTETQAVRSASFTADNLKPTVAMVWKAEPLIVTSLEIVDDIINSGQLKVKMNEEQKAAIDEMVAEARQAAEDRSELFNEYDVVHYVWYKNINGGGFQRVQSKGKNYNLADDGSWLNVVLDEGALNDKQTSVKYKVRLVLNNVEQILEDESKAVYSVSHWNEVRNGSFETPVIEANLGYEQLKSGREDLVWETTGKGEQNGSPNHDIEIINMKKMLSNSEAKNQYGWNDTWKATVPDGEQFAEINCETEGALYQDVLTVPGEQLNYWFSHRARPLGLTQSNIMYVVIMPTRIAEEGIDGKGALDTYERLDSVIKLSFNTKKEYGIVTERCVANVAKWTENKGTYTPITYSTRFFFVSANANSRTKGNYIDNIGFSQKLPPANPGKFDIQITKTIEGFTSQELNLSDLNDQEKSEAIKNKIGNLSFKITARYPSDAEAEDIPLNNQTISIVDEGWKWKENVDGTYTGIYKFPSQSIDSGTQYIYSIEEIKEENDSYNCQDTLEIVGGTVQDDGRSTLLGEKSAVTFKFTNTYSPKTSELTIHKVWKDAGNTYNVRPTEVEILVETSTDGTNWKHYVTEGHNDGKYILSVPGSVSENGNPNQWSYSLEVSSSAQYRFTVVDSDSHYTSPTEPIVLGRDQKEVTITSVLNWKMLKQGSIADQSGKYPLLANAIFELKDLEKKIIATGESDENGVITWTSNESSFDLKNLEGTYTITETKAPGGFSLAESDWQITFEEGIPKVNTPKQYVMTETGVDLIFKNTPLYELPSTGGDGIFVYMISGTLLMIASMLALYKRKLAGRC